MLDILHAPLSDRRAHSSMFVCQLQCYCLSVCAMQGQKDLGFLMNPGEGAISAVALYVPPGGKAPTHLFSGGVDGTLAVWSAGRSWDCLKLSNWLHLAYEPITCCHSPSVLPSCSSLVTSLPTFHISIPVHVGTVS